MFRFILKSSYSAVLLLMFYAATMAQTPLVIMTEDHIGGYANDVTANQNNVFFCQAYSLKALTFDGTTFSTAGSLVLPWPGLIAYASNSELYLGSQTHIARIGISNLSNMTIPASNTIGTGGDEITSIFMLSDKLYVTMHNWNAKTGAFKILNKITLSLLGSIDVVSQDVQVVGTTAYVITGHSTIGDLSQYLKIYNVANPSNISEVGGIQISGAEKLYVNGNYVYIVGINRTGITIVDVSNPAAPAIIGTNLAVNGGINRIKYANNTLYTAGSQKIYLVDITNLVDPVQKGSAEASAYITHITNFTTPTFNSFLLYTADGELNSFNVTFPQNPVAGPQNESPSKTTSMTITGNNLFVGDLTSVWRYDLANSDAQTKYMTINNKIISSFGNNLYVVSDEPAYSKLTVVDISNINSPQQKGTYQSNAKISKIAAKGNYVYLLQENSNIVEVVNATNTSAPAQVFTYQLTNTGTSLFAAKENNKNILYAGYYGNEGSKGVELINISNPAALTKLSTIATSGNPKGIHASENNLYVGSSTSDERGWYLEAFDVTNTQNPVLSASTSNTSAGEIIWDIFAMQNRLLVSFTLDGLKTYELVQSSGKINQKSLIKTASALNDILAQTSSSSYTYYTHDIAAYQSDNNLYAYVNAETWAPQANYPLVGHKGMFKLKIPDFPPAGVGETTFLTMNINPPEAANWGCTTNPSPGGPYEYEFLEIAQISAEDVPEFGWYFKDWTGATGGKETSLIMDADHDVTANFVEIVLTLSGSAPAEAICPYKALEQPNRILPLKLTASSATGWIVHSITFRSSGTGDESKDITSVDIYRNKNIIGKSKYTIDNGECVVSFNEPIIVPANQSVLLDLYYVFDYDTTTYSYTNTNTFCVEAKSMNAEPQLYPDGLKLPLAKRDKNFTIARIYNSKREGFTIINYAINGASTSEGDTCFVCADEYNESIILNKNISLLGIEGAEKTIINGNNETVLHASSGKLIKGFTFISTLNMGIFIMFGTDLQFTYNRTLLNKIEFHLSKNIDITNNTFINLKSLELTTDGSRINNNQATATTPYILLFGSDNEIFGNTNFYLNIGTYESKSSKYKSNFIGNNALSRVSIIKSSFNTIIANNIYGSPDYGIEISGGDETSSSSIDNVIDNNEIFSNNHHGIFLSNANSTIVRGNKIYDNNKAGMVVYNNSIGTEVYKNSIYNNTEDGILTSKARYVKIHDNLIKNHQKQKDKGGIVAGVYVDFSNDIKVYSNRIIQNCTGVFVNKSPSTYLGLNNIIDAQCIFTGIHLNNSSPDILGNTIANNAGNGIFAENGSNPIVRANNFFGNSVHAINNSDPSVTINASGNWWGNAAGPSANDIAGNLDASGWLTSQVSLLCYSAKDTVHSAVGKIDSALVYFQNFENPDDVLDITVSDEMGWITSPLNFASQMQDSLGTFANIIFNVPVNANQGAINKVLVKGTSQTGINVSVKDSFYICIYNPTLQTITVSPDSATAAPGDSVQFYISGSDQYGNTIAVSPTWQANLGEINTDGVFSSSTTGIAEVTATDPVSGLQAKTKILITDQEEQLAEIKISPSSSTVKSGESISLTAKGYNQFGFPYHTMVIWSCNKGYVDNNGIFTADSIEGTCTITAEDTTIGIKGTATVYVEVVVGIEEEKVVPTNYTLFQNYPNPFNPTTTIKYSLPAAGMVTLEVFNILGEKVVRLVNEMKHTGYHEVKWNTTGFASGVYFYMIYVKTVDNGKEFRATKKMVLLK